jgi:hypothetical protein
MPAISPLNTNVKYVTGSSTVALSSAAYDAGDVVGGIITFSKAIDVENTGGIIKSAKLIDYNFQKTQTDLILFKTKPASSTGIPNHGAAKFPDSDMAEIVGTVKFSTGEYIAFDTNCVAMSYDEVPFNLGSDKNLYGVLITRGTPTYIKTETLPVTLNIQRL